MVKMNISEQILSEIAQYHKINKYIIEQDVTAADPTTEPVTEPAPDAGALPPSDVAGTTPPVDTTIEPQPIDVENDPDVEVVGDENTEGGEEELEITDLISAQKNIESKQEEYFNNLVSGNYTLYVLDSIGNVTNSSVSVPQTTAQNYVLSVNFVGNPTGNFNTGNWAMNPSSIYTTT